MKINKYISKKEMKNLIVQANNGNTLFQLLDMIMESPKSKREISEKLNFKERQADYYSKALGSMGLAEVYEYPTGKIVGVSKKAINIQSKKDLANYLIKEDYVRREDELNKESNLSDETKKRRNSSIKNLNKWIEGNK